MKRSSAVRTVFASIATLAFSSALVAPSAQAAPPPKGYPTAHIEQTTYNAKLKANIPLRRGFYDATSNAGFGWDKLWNKHNIWDIAAVPVLSRSPNVTPQGTSRLLRTWAGKMTCSAFICRVTAQREIKLVYVAANPHSYTYKDKRTGKKVSVSTGNDGKAWGVQTAYCENPDKSAKCPQWVTYSLTHPGRRNPYGLKTAAAASTEQMVYSYTPLPKSMSQQSLTSLINRQRAARG